MVNGLILHMMRWYVCRCCRCHAGIFNLSRSITISMFMELDIMIDWLMNIRSGLLQSMLRNKCRSIHANLNILTSDIC